MSRLFKSAVFLSNDEIECADATQIGYREIIQHPREIGKLVNVKLLVIDFNQILFDDHELAINIANEAARKGIIVGIHTYYPEALKLHRLAKLPNVLVAKTHRRLLHKVGRYAELRARARRKFANAALPLKGMVTHVRDHDCQPDDAFRHADRVPAKV